MFLQDLRNSIDNYGDEWYMPYFDGYTGPYYSAGKIQGSTTKNPVQPRGRLGHLSREHDFRYATANSCDDLDRADQIYYEKSRGMSLIPRSIGAIPLYANAPARKIARMMGSTCKGSEAHLAGSKTNEISMNRSNLRRVIGGPVQPSGVPDPPKNNRDTQPSVVTSQPNSGYDRWKNTDPRVPKEEPLPTVQAMGTSKNTPLPVLSGQSVDSNPTSRAFVYIGNYMQGRSLVRACAEKGKSLRNVFAFTSKPKKNKNKNKSVFGFKRNKVYMC